MRWLLPGLLGLAGLLAGGGAGYMLRPAAAPPDNAHDATAGEGTAPAEAGHAGDAAAPRDYARLTNQFVIPLLDRGQVRSMVILSLSLEVEAGTAETVYAREPRLRDQFLQVLFAHANAGGFRGDFTEAATLDTLRRALREAAQATMGPIVSDVLISDIVRQDS